MGRLPMEIGKVTKKGSWIPEEDVILVSYVQENGPNNWRHVPNRAGLQRSSKSCRLRWTNHLRPGIKRDKFTDEEDEKIIRLHTLFGNKWATISRYLSGRTDSNIKNYWNTHLKKKMNMPVLGRHGDSKQGYAGSNNGTTTYESDQVSGSSKGVLVERLQTNVHLAKQALPEAVSPSPATVARAHVATSSPASLGIGSSKVMGTTTLLSSGLMSFNPPRVWYANSNQQQLIPINHHHSSTPAVAQINQASNFFLNSHPRSAENGAQWLQKWSKESPGSVLTNEESAILKKSQTLYEQRMMDAIINANNNSKIPSLTTENHMLDRHTGYISPTVDTAPSLPKILDGHYDKNNYMPLLNMTGPYDQSSSLKFY